MELHEGVSPPHAKEIYMVQDKKKTILLYLGPMLIVLVGFLYLPIIINFANSLYTWGALSKKREFIGLLNYARLFSDEVFYIAIRNNLVFIIMSLVFQIGCSLMIAAVLESKFLRKFQAFFRTVYFIPSLLMVTVTGITFKMIYSPSIGLINPMLKLIGINTDRIDLLGNPSSAIFAVSAASQWQYIGYTVILFIVALQNIPEELYEAAEIDGSNALQTFFRITLPQMRDTITINMIIIVTGAIRVFDEVYVMTSGGPGRATETLATYLYRVGFRNDEMGYASAIAFFVFAVTFILGLLQMKGYRMDDRN
jgi:raffinose/stachyose/melibiose transport system permease protein